MDWMSLENSRSRTAAGMEFTKDRLEKQQMKGAKEVVKVGK